MAKERDLGTWPGVERRSGRRGPVPAGGERRRPMSSLSPLEFVRLARMRAGLDPELPPDGEVVEAGAEVASDPPDADPARGRDGSPPGVDAGATATGGPDRGRWHWPAGAARMDGFEAGVASVVEALGALEAPGDLDDGCLAARVADLVRLQSLVTAQLAEQVRAWDARCLWGSDRSKSPGARLARDANCAKGTASTMVWLARAVARMPHTAVAWGDGRISTDHVRRLVRACSDERLEAFLKAEEGLIAEAVRLAGNYRGFNRFISVWEEYTDDDLHDPTDPDDLPKGTKKQQTGRHGFIRESNDGFDFAGSLPRVDGVIVRNQWQNIVDELWRNDWNEARARLGEGAVISEADLGRTNRQRWADALVEMARRAGATRPGDQMPRPLITVHVTADDLCGPIRETFNGIVLSRRDVAELIADEADWERIVSDPAGQPVTLTSVQRNFTGLLRRAVQIRDRVCSHPTCDVDAERCHVDHIIEHTAGGPTNLDNARLLCPCHNLQRPGRGKTPPRRGTDRDRDGDGDDADGPGTGE